MHCSWQNPEAHFPLFCVCQTKPSQWEMSSKKKSNAVNTVETFLPKGECINLHSQSAHASPLPWPRMLPSMLLAGAEEWSNRKARAPTKMATSNSATTTTTTTYTAAATTMTMMTTTTMATMTMTVPTVNGNNNSDKKADCQELWRRCSHIPLEPCRAGCCS